MATEKYAETTPNITKQYLKLADIFVVNFVKNAVCCGNIFVRYCNFSFSTKHLVIEAEFKV